jgi:hypothetical protein
MLDSDTLTLFEPGLQKESMVAHDYTLAFEGCPEEARHDLCSSVGGVTSAISTATNRSAICVSSCIGAPNDWLSWALLDLKPSAPCQALPVGSRALRAQNFTSRART